MTNPERLALPIDALSFRDRSYPLDERGFLADPDMWSKRFAAGMAHRLGIIGDLTLDHWRIIFFVRRFFEREQGVPRIHETCKQGRTSRSRLLELFPAGYQRGVCRLAGLPYSFIVTDHYALTYEVERSVPPRYEICGSGFLRDFWSWDDGFALATAGERSAGQLSGDHWRVIDFLRESFASSGRPPTLGHTCTALGLTRTDVDELFPEGYRRGACRMAGIPAIAS